MQCCKVTRPSAISQLIYNFMQLHVTLRTFVKLYAYMGLPSGWAINYILAHKPIQRQLRSEGSMEDTLEERLVISEELACVPWLAVVRSFCKASDGVMPRFADNHLISRPALFAKNYRPSSIRAWYNHSKCLNHQMCAKSITWVKPYVWHMHPQMPSSISDVCQRYKLAIFNGFINRHIWRLILKNGRFTDRTNCGQKVRMDRNRWNASVSWSFTQWLHSKADIGVVMMMMI